MASDGTVIYFLLSILFIAALIFVILLMTRQTSPRLNKDKYRSDWLKIELSLKKEDESSHQLSVLNADKLLDQALRERGVAGQTMGDRMKAAKKYWSNANSVWSAHKLRNRIAHEANTKVTYKESAHALVAFKRALKDLGAV